MGRTCVSKNQCVLAKYALILGQFLKNQCNFVEFALKIRIGLTFHPLNRINEKIFVQWDCFFLLRGPVCIGPYCRFPHLHAYLKQIPQTLLHRRQRHARPTAPQRRHRRQDNRQVRTPGHIPPDKHSGKLRIRPLLHLQRRLTDNRRMPEGRDIRRLHEPCPRILRPRHTRPGTREKEMTTKWEYEAYARECAERARAEGIAEGETRGEAKGEANTRREVAKKMLAKGMALSDICDITGLPKSEIEKMKN